MIWQLQNGDLDCGHHYEVKEEGFFGGGDSKVFILQCVKCEHQTMPDMIEKHGKNGVHLWEEHDYDWFKCKFCGLKRSRLAVMNLANN